VSSFALAQERVNVYTRFPLNESTPIAAGILLKDLNSKFEGKYDFKLQSIPGSGGEAADMRSLADATVNQKSIIVGSISAFTINKYLLNSKLDRDKDFIPVMLFLTLPNTLMVHPDLDINTVDDLVRYVKSKKESFVATTVQATSTKLLNSVFTAKYNITNTTNINYKSPGEVTKSVLQKETDYSVQNPIDSPGLKLLAISSPNRSNFFPSVPTGKEVGFPEFNYESTVMFYAPRADEKFINSIKEAMRESCVTPAVVEIAATMKQTLECMMDRDWLLAEIKRQQVLVDKHKDSLK
jgi:tripartite-type tricarboxylate transporter receptor subunit TctC